MAKFGATDLVLRADLPFTRTFTYQRDGVPQSWAGRTNRLQMRHPWSSQLLIELTAFLEVDATDPTRLVLTLPGDFTGKLAQEGRWDILSLHSSDPSDVVRTPSPPGRIVVLQGVTSRV